MSEKPRLTEEELAAIEARFVGHVRRLVDEVRWFRAYRAALLEFTREPRP